MSPDSTFHPSIKKILLASIIFLVSGFTIFYPSVSGIFEIVVLVFLFLLSYILSSIFVSNFRLKYLKQATFPLKLIILFLIFELASILIDIFRALISTSPGRALQAFSFFHQYPTIGSLFLFISLVSLLTHKKYTYIFASSYFVYYLFLLLMVGKTGLITASPIMEVVGGNLSHAIMFLDGLCFFIFAISFLVMRGYVSKGIQRITTILLILSFLSFKLNIGNLAFGHIETISFLPSLIESILFFSILTFWHWYSK